jgi:hypothetical protein
VNIDDRINKILPSIEPRDSKNERDKELAELTNRLLREPIKQLLTDVLDYCQPSETAERWYNEKPDAAHERDDILKVYRVRRERLGI